MARIPIRMPKMSMTMTEGEVSEWHVQVGDTVAEGDVVCEVLTDKVDMEVESPGAGVLTSIEVDSGMVDVGVPIGWLEGDDSGGLGDLLAPPVDDSTEPVADAGTQPAAADTPPPARPTSQAAASQQAAAPERPGPVPAVPRARALARERGLDLTHVPGSGPNGLVLVSDIEAAGPPQRQSGTPRPTTPADAGTTTSKRPAQIRALVAGKMVESATVPQFTLWRDLVLDRANTTRNGLSWTTVLVRAYATALRQVPALLQRWEAGAPVESGPPSVGLAVDTPDGLLAPVLLAPDEADARVLDHEIRSLVSTAQSGRIDATYLRPANGMVSNLGGLGVDRFQALVTPPQASVLSLGAIAPRPVAVPGGLGTALTVTVGLTVDHRVADGADGARLLAALVDALHDIPA